MEVTPAHKASVVTILGAILRKGSEVSFCCSRLLLSFSII